MENRWNAIESKLENISSRVTRLRQNVGLKETNDTIQYPAESNGILSDLVIQANPKYPPYSIQFFLLALSQVVPIYTKVHVHSSLTNDLAFELKDFLELNSECKESQRNDRNKFSYGITVIWKSTGKDPVLVVNPTTPVVGEVNIIRYLARITESMSHKFSGISHAIKYDSLPPAKLSQVDEQLDCIHQLIHNECPKQRKASMQRLLNRQKDLLNESSSIADIALLSACIGEERRNANFLSKDDKQVVTNIRDACVTKNPFFVTSILKL